MFETVDYRRSISSRKIKWNKTDYFGKYFLTSFLTLCLLPALAEALFHDELIFYGVSVVIFCLAILSFFTVRLNDNLIEVPLKIEASKLRILIRDEIESDGWTIYRNNLQYLVSVKPGKWSAGSRLTILFDKKFAFINVQNLYGNRGYYPFSFGRNKRITKMLIGIIQANDAKA